MNRQQFYKTPQWKELSKAYAKSVNYLCERCSTIDNPVPGKICHHKIHLNDINYLDPKISLNWDNIEYLCQDCHNKEHFSMYDEVIWDDKGNIIDVKRRDNEETI